MYPDTCEIFLQPLENLLMVGIQYSGMRLFGLIFFFLFYLLDPLGYGFPVMAS